MNRQRRPLQAIAFSTIAILIICIPAPIAAQGPAQQQLRIDDRARVICDGPCVLSTQKRVPMVRTTANVTILIYKPELDTGERLRGLGYTVTETFDTFDLFRSNLQNYDVLWLDVGSGPQWNPTLVAEIQPWVAEDGGGLIYTQPNDEGEVELFPPGFEVTVYSEVWPGWPGEFGFVHIIDGSHPITAGLEDIDAGANGDRVWWDDIGPSWQVLGVDASMPDDVVALLAGEYGAGRLFFNTGNFSTGSSNKGSDQYVIQLLSWVSQKEPPPAPWSVAATVGGALGEGTDGGVAGGTVARDSSMLNPLAFLLLPLAVVVVLRTRMRRGA